MIDEELLSPRQSTIKEKVTVRQKVYVNISQNAFKEAEEAINEYWTGKKTMLFKEKKTKGHKEAMDMLWKMFETTLTFEIDCKTGKKTCFKEKKRPNIFQIEYSEISNEPVKERE